MNNKNLMNAIGGISERHIECRAPQESAPIETETAATRVTVENCEKRGRGWVAVLAAAAALLLVFGLVSVLHIGGRSPVDPANVGNETAEPGTTAEPDEERILGGEPLPLDFSALISDGILIDVDGDGEKEHLTAKRGQPASRFNLLVDAEETDIWLDAATEASFFSLFGDTIQLGVDETEPYSMLRDYLYLNGEAEQPTPERGASVMCIAPAQNKWMNNSSSLFFPDTSVRELPRFASIEECIEAGASADLHFPLMSSIDENNDVSLELDLDGDGSREKLLLKAGRILVYSPDAPSEPVFEVPYAPPNEEEIVARYIAEGYEVYAAPCFEYFVNGVRCDLFDAENGASSLPYESSICFAKAPNGGIMLLSLYGGYRTIEYKNGFLVGSVSLGENDDGGFGTSIYAEFELPEGFELRAEKGDETHIPLRVTATVGEYPCGYIYGPDGVLVGGFRCLPYDGEDGSLEARYAQFRSGHWHIMLEDKYEPIGSDGPCCPALTLAEGVDVIPGQSFAANETFLCDAVVAYAPSRNAVIEIVLDQGLMTQEQLVAIGQSIRIETEATLEQTEDPSAPSDEWLVENAWPIAELANESFGLNFRREDNSIYPYHEIDGSVYQYAVNFPGDEAAISVYFELEGTDEWHVTYSNVGAEGGTLQEKYSEVDLSYLHVTEEELRAAGIQLDGTDADYLKIAKYCAEKRVERNKSCSEDNAFRCLEAEAAEPYVYQPDSWDVMPNDCRVPLRFYPADIRSFLDAAMDIGCGIAGPDDPYPGWVYFHMDLSVFIEPAANGWNCRMGYGS